MREFARLFSELDSTTGTNAKVEAIAAYLARSDPADAAWAVFFLTGRRLPSVVRRRDLRDWACQAAGVPDWLFDECYAAVADLAETIARILPSVLRTESDMEAPDRLSAWVERVIVPLGKQEPEAQRERLLAAWSKLGQEDRLVFNKLITGSFRVGVSQETVLKAVSHASGVPRSTLSHRMMGDWQPTPEAYAALIDPEERADADRLRPYPFALAHALTEDLESLGDPGDWLAEWKWDGIRCQALRREGEIALWSRGEGLIQESFPELAEVVAAWPNGVVLDGEVLAWREDRPLPFSELQRRLNRKAPGRKLLADVPCVLRVFDILELDSEDLRATALASRRDTLEEFVLGHPHPALLLSPRVVGDSWKDLAIARTQAKQRGAEGLMLKRLDSAYEGGRKRGVWWKWKVDPFSVDAVLVYAQRGSGKRASLYTDYTFAVWHEGALVPFAKAYSGLTDAEIAEVDAFVRRHTQERFGPVRTVQPELVFELAFEGIQLSNRHKSGVAVRFPRIARWRKDKRPEDADRLEDVKALIRAGGPTGA